MTVDYGESFATRLARHELLSACDERRLSELVQIGRDAQERIDAGLDSSVLRSAVEAGTNARNRLVQANQRLVMMLAGRYSGSGVDRMDLIQEGNVALLRAAEKFDGRKGFRFSTYADNWISAYMSIHSAESRSSIRIPKTVYAKIETVRNAAASLQIALSRVPTDQEVSQESGLMPDEVAQVGRLPKTTSLEAHIGFETTLTLLDLLPDVTGINPEEEALTADERAVLVEAVQSLAEPHRSIIQLRYGLSDSHTWRAEDIARKLGIPRSAVASGTKEALCTLRETCG